MTIFCLILLVIAVIVTGVNCFATTRSFQQERRATIHHSAVASAISDRRPYEQRVDTPRQARRLNHPFQHLYRHNDPRFDDNEWTADTDTSSSTTSSQHYPQKISDFYWDKIMTKSNSTFAQQPVDVETSLNAIYYLHLHGGYSLDEIHQLHKSFPPLLEIDVIRHLRPKMRFLKDCLEGCIVSSYPNSQSSMQTLDPKLKAALPGSFYGSRYERTIAPRHAFLIHL